MALLTSGFLPEWLSLLLPVAGAAVGAVIYARTKINLPAEVLPAEQPRPVIAASVPAVPGPEVSRAASTGAAATVQAAPLSRSNGDAKVSAEFAPVVEYLRILEDMIISEGQKDTLDNEIVEKSLALFARLQHVIPLLEELGNGEINHTVRRLVLKDLNAVINPFLRLGGEAKSKNRRMLLNGLRDVDSKISDIASTIEHKDLMELQTKAELIHQRYSSSEL